jgi:hypothetical protein
MFLDMQNTEYLDDGSLYIKRFPEHTDLRVMPWRKKLVVCTTRLGDIFRIPGDIGIVLLNRAHDRLPEKAPIKRFVNDIPPEVRERVVEYIHLQQTLLRLCATFKGAYDLLMNNQLLLWLVADYAIANRLRFKQIGSLLRKKQVEILKRTTGVGEKSTIKLLRMLSPIKGDAGELQTLRSILENTEMLQHFRHCKTITIDQLARVTHYPHLACLPLVQHYAEKDETPCGRIDFEFTQLLKQCNDTLRLGTQLKISDVMFALKRCSTASDLTQLHDRWVVKFNKENFNTDGTGTPFKYTPPIPSCESIVAISTAEALLTEGIVQNNCVGTYVPLVEEGKCFIYKTSISKERGTLCINIDNGKFSIGDFELSLGRDPSCRSWRAVRAWIDSHIGTGKVPSPYQEQTCMNQSDRSTEDKLPT